jgi:hypothetical protein
MATRSKLWLLISKDVHWHLLLAADGAVQQGTLVIINFKRNTNARQRGEDITENNYAVWPEAPPRLSCRRRQQAAKGAKLQILCG